MVAAFAVAPVVLITLLIGLRGVAVMRTSSDFLVASRRISPLLNSAAVSGEYLLVASFLGVAGLVVKNEMGALWYPVGFTAGYIAMLVLVAAPMRRSGALTVPDFAEARLASPALRLLAAIVVLVIGTLYLVPQFRTAGLVLNAVGGTPYWVGVVIAGTAVSATLALGGMRAATYVQAFQFVLKLVLFIVPAVWLVLQVSPAQRLEALNPVEFTHFPHQTTVSFRLDATLEIREPTLLGTDGALKVQPPGELSVHTGQKLTFGEGAAVPGVRGGMPLGGPDWQRPLLDYDNKGYPLLGTWAVLIATMLGTMGLPHVLMRFHTSPDGRAARRTAAITVALLGVFYLLPRHLRGAGADHRAGAVPVRSDRHGSRRAAVPSGLRLGRAAVHHALDRRRVRGVTGHLARPAAGRVRRDRARPDSWQAATAALDGDRGGRGDRAARAAVRETRRRYPGELGFHRGRVHLLPAAGAGDLVEPAHRNGCYLWRFGGTAGILGINCHDVVRPEARRTARHPGRAARPVVRAARVRDDGGGVVTGSRVDLVDGRHAAPSSGRARAGPVPLDRGHPPFVDRSSPRTLFEPLSIPPEVWAT